MATHVYANDLEIACKSTDGVASTAFPDPCWSPPPPKGGPILVPYGNVAVAQDITNGTKTVFIMGQTVAIEDRAYFSTSTGNEPATYAFQKGLQTNVIKGKAYFRSWSMDVIFEGLGVDRHTDLVSHNHGSMPGNTPLFPYLSRADSDTTCSKEKERIEKACKPDNEHQKELRKKNTFLQKLEKVKRNDNKKGAEHWTSDHCAGMSVDLDKLGTLEDQYNEAVKVFDELTEAFKEIPSMSASTLKEYLQDMAVNAGAKAAGKVAVKAGIKQAAGSWLPLVGNIIMGLWTAYDAVEAIMDVSAIKEAAEAALEQLDLLEKARNEVSALLEEARNFKNLSPEQKKEAIFKLLAQMQDVLATLDGCTRARKCNLVPYSNKIVNNKKTEPANDGGCCPGQTGHHLIYDKMMEECKSNYSKGGAPTVCTEGLNQYVGSHGRVHSAMDKEVKDLVGAGKATGGENGKMKMSDAINAAVNSHMSAFPLSRCSKNCIRKQLEEYYGKTCSEVKVVDKGGRPVGDDGNSGRG